MTAQTEKGASSLIKLSVWLAARDWMQEFSLSICGILALASMLAPLLVLHGVHNGVIQRLRENLMKDPGVLVIIPSGVKGAGFSASFLDEAGKAPGISYIMGRTRAVAAELQVVSAQGKRQIITLEATSEGDPLFIKFDKLLPVSNPDNLQIALTATAAAKLDVKTGDKLEAALNRRTSAGRPERQNLQLTVVSVLPQIASNQDAGFVDMPLLQAIQDFRDGISAPLFNYSGEQEAPTARHYESFRAYVKDINDVEIAEEWFKEHETPVQTRAKEIANIRKIDSTLGAVISLIACAGVAGFLAFMASTSLAAVRRKWKEIGMLRLTGFSKLSLWVFPLVQVVLTGIFGCFLAFLLYIGVAYSIDAFFAEETGNEAICVISFPSFAVIFIAVQILAILASGWAAKKAAAISPVDVIREA